MKASLKIDQKQCLMCHCHGHSSGKGNMQNKKKKLKNTETRSHYGRHNFSGLLWEVCLRCSPGSPGPAVANQPASAMYWWDIYPLGPPPIPIHAHSHVHCHMALHATRDNLGRGEHVSLTTRVLLWPFGTYTSGPASSIFQGFVTARSDVYYP